MNRASDNSASNDYVDRLPLCRTTVSLPLIIFVSARCSHGTWPQTNHPAVILVLNLVRHTAKTSLCKETPLPFTVK